MKKKRIERLHLKTLGNDMYHLHLHSLVLIGHWKVESRNYVGSSVGSKYIGLKNF